ncbi:dihydrofolate reductase family protein [Aeromicrobium sp.]|uniref:dihydrofolate reductase family protein n=1 Tax=Aeromicrobium sp. TaxID=1871063 RepID=UPI003D6AB7F8
MGNVIFGMNTSVDGYVAGPSGDLDDFGTPGDELHQYFNDLQSSAALSLYGRELYRDMQYWDTEDPNRNAVQEEFAAAWRATPKVVVSTTLSEVGPNATLVSEDVDAELRRVVAATDGEIDVGGPTLAATLTRLGLVDEYRIYQRPVVLGGGKPFFPEWMPNGLSLLDVEILPDDTVLLRYAPVR